MDTAMAKVHAHYDDWKRLGPHWAGIVRIDLWGTRKWQNYHGTRPSPADHHARADIALDRNDWGGTGAGTPPHCRTSLCTTGCATKHWWKC